MRTIVVSDLHIGSAYFMRDRFLSFINTLQDGDTLIMNGDVVDRPNARLSDDDQKVIARLEDVAGRGKVVWVAGNHDRKTTAVLPSCFEYATEYIVDGRICVTHGDRFVKTIPGTALVIEIIRLHYYLVLAISRRRIHVGEYAKRWGFLYRSLLKNVRRHAVEHAQKHGYAVVMCGHVHFAEDSTIDGVRYINTGAWTEEQASFAVIDDAGICLRDSREIRANLD